MADARVTEILRLCEGALAREGAERAAYLDAACRGDAELRRDVEALLAQDSTPAAFVETPAWRRDGEPPAARPSLDANVVSAGRAAGTQPALSRLAPGTRLGPYQVESLIGTGGMGEVYKARDTRLDRSVAIKILPPEVSGDSDRRARFEREAKTIARLSHPHICPLYDVGEHDPTSSGQAALYLVMEYLAGETLAQRLQKGPLKLDQALAIATEIADALAAAHRQGVIHRDLKPGNVMLTKSGAPSCSTSVWRS
jgi:serine/threonine protein kinase